MAVLPRFSPADLDVRTSVPLDTRMPLQIKPPVFDLGSALEKASAIRGNELTNQGTALLNTGRQTANAEGALRLQESQDTYGALKGYRDAQAAGDPAAMDKLAGYPEMQLQMRQSLDGMKDAERGKVIQRGLMLAHAAREVSAFPPGSAERQEALNDQLDGLLENEMIDEDTYERFYDQPPSDVMLDQLLVMGQSLDQYIADERAEESAKVTKKETTAAAELELRLKLDEAARKQVEAGISQYETVDAAEMRQRIKDAKTELYQEYGLLPADAEEAPIAGAPATDATEYTEDAPAEPTSQEEFDALPVDAWFINPADGQLMQKAN